MNIVQTQTETSTTAVLTGLNQNQISLTTASDILANMNSALMSYVDMSNHDAICVEITLTNVDQREINKAVTRR